MLDFPKWKINLIILACLCGIIFALPSLLGEQYNNNIAHFFPTKKVNLGLDLKGGSHLLLEVDFDNYLNEQIENFRDAIRKTFRNNNIGYFSLKKVSDTIEFSLREEKTLVEVKNLLKNDFSNLSIKDNPEKENYTIFLNEQAKKELKNKIVEQSIEIIRLRVDETGTKEPVIQRQGDNYILLQVPGLFDPNHLKNLLGQTAKLSFHLLNYNASPDSIRAPFGSIIVKGDNNSKFVVHKKHVLTGEMLEDARASFDDKNLPVVSFSFNNIGAKKFAKITKDNVGKALAIILDNKVISAPVIDEPIIGGKGIIRGNFSIKAANDLALLLRAGALPAPLKIIEERTVGPSLGSDSIEAGKNASIIAVLAVMIFMVLTYGLFGLIANIALFFNLIFLLAALACLQATLTLPGIAGIVLTMGMSVDANVLIFERIREESRNGLTIYSSLTNGFKQAFTTILDSNLTTIFAAVLLYLFGSGAVKGFAVTLIIGILSSMFTAITLTRLMIIIWLKKCKPQKINL